MPQTDKNDSFVLPLTGYLALWVLLVDIGAIPFPGPLFFSAVLFVIFPATLVATMALRGIWRTLYNRGQVRKNPSPQFWRNAALSCATILVALFLLNAEDVLRHGVQDAASQLERLAKPDVNRTQLKELSTRFVVVADRLLDDFFSTSDLTELEARQAQTRVQDFAQAISDGTLTKHEVEKLLRVYTAVTTQTTDSSAAP